MDHGLWHKVERKGDCWIYLGSPSQQYPKVTRGGVKHDVARYVWALFGRPPIIDGETLHRTCRNTRCIRLPHMEPRLISELVAESNRQRGAALTHCKRGHPRGGENSRVWTNPKTGWTMTWCRLCDRDRKRSVRAERRGESLRRAVRDLSAAPAAPARYVNHAVRDIGSKRPTSTHAAPWFPFVWFTEYERILEPDELAEALHRHAKEIIDVIQPLMKVG